MPHSVENVTLIGLSHSVLIGMLNKRLQDRMVEEEAKYSVGRVDWDVAKQIMYACTEWLLIVHWFVVRQWPRVRGAQFGGVGGLGVRDDVVDIVRSTVARHSSTLAT